jgi:hypothetical protein
MAAGTMARPEGDRAEHGVDDLVPVGHEHGLMTVPAVRARPPVAGISGQQPGEDAAAGLQHPGPDHGLGRLQAGAVTAQRPGSLGSQPAYLG